VRGGSSRGEQRGRRAEWSALPPPLLTSFSHPLPLPPSLQVTLKAAETADAGAGGADGEDDYFSATFDNPFGDGVVSSMPDDDPMDPSDAGHGGAGPHISSAEGRAGGGADYGSLRSVRDMAPVVGRMDEAGGALSRKGMRLKPGDVVS
jgi:hypothetical protein